MQIRYKKWILTFGGMVIASLAATVSADASSVYWTNGAWSSSEDPSWSAPGNWSPRVPKNGDTLVFSTNKANGTLENPNFSNNNMSGLMLSSVKLTGNTQGHYALVGNTLNITNEIRDDNKNPENIDVIVNNIYSRGNVRITSLENSRLVLGGKMYVGNYITTLQAHHNSFNYFDGGIRGLSRSKIYVVGDKSGGVAFGENAKVSRPVVVKDRGILYLNGRSVALHVTTSGLLMPTQCSQTQSLRIQGYFYPEILGSPPSCENASKIIVNGQVDIIGGKLVPDYMLKYYSSSAPSGDQGPPTNVNYLLVSNDGTDKIKGTFKDLPEGSTFWSDYYKFKITYKGGTGNDIVIRRIQ